MKKNLNIVLLGYWFNFITVEQFSYFFDIGFLLLRKLEFSDGYRNDEKMFTRTIQYCHLSLLAVFSSSLVCVGLHIKVQ